jgi:hypothetical protein
LWRYKISVDGHYFRAIFILKINGTDVHEPWMDFGVAVVRVENDAQLPVFVGKHGAVPHPDQIFGFLVNGIPLVFFVGSHDIFGGGKPNTVKLAFVVVGRIAQIVDAVS